MVDVGDKPVTTREAVAESTVIMAPETLAMITANTTPKGDVFAAARIAGVMAAKRTGELIPLCHSLPLTAVEVALFVQLPDRVRIVATARCDYKTGVEMEALTAATVAGLTVYDMLKAVDRGMTMTDVRLLKKTGGKSGTYIRPE